MTADDGIPNLKLLQKNIENPICSLGIMLTQKNFLKALKNLSFPGSYAEAKPHKALAYCL